jgi:hypothetical protein
LIYVTTKFRKLFGRALMVAGMLVLAAGVVIVYAVLRSPDPFDRFELLGVATAPGAQRYAATYRYYHSNSSATVTAIWILSGQPPALGSNDPVPGDPDLVWRGKPDMLQVTWQGETQRWLVGVKGPVDIHDFPDCYFADPAPPNLICLQPSRIDLRVAN